MIHATIDSRPELAPRPGTARSRSNDMDRKTTTDRVLVIAGHDSSGEAGVDADRAAARDLGHDVECVVTARTDQDSSVVRAVGARDVADWTAEARKLWDEVGGFGAVKFGLLPGAEHVRAAGKLIDEWRKESSFVAIVDPVIASSSGFEFLGTDARRALSRELLPRGVILTPNLAELALLTDADEGELAEDLDLRVREGKGLLDLGASAVVVKGGHGVEDPLCDLMLRAGERASWRTIPRVTGVDGTASMRGTGCRFATALAIGLATGLDFEASVDQAGRYVAGQVAAHSSGRPRAWDRAQRI